MRDRHGKHDPAPEPDWHRRPAGYAGTHPAGIAGTHPPQAAELIPDDDPGSYYSDLDEENPDDGCTPA